MARTGALQVPRPKAGARSRAQTIAATRLLSLASDEIAMLAVQAALKNPALRVTFVLDEEPLPPTLGHRSWLQPLSFLDEGAVAAPPQSLYEHVARQIPLLVRDRHLLPVAHAWLEGLEPTGWVSLQSIEVAARCSIPLECAEHVLHLLQGAEPDGLFARTLQECLTLQLRARNELTSEMEALLADLPMLASGDLAALAEKTRIPNDVLPDLIGRLRRLNPKPGTQFQGEHPALPASDFLIERVNGMAWELRRDRWLKPTINFASTEARALVSDLHQASAFAALLENRDRLVYKATLQAITWQSDFLEGASRWQRPMALRDVAGPLGVHETSIGRIRNHVVIGDGTHAIRLRDLFCPAIVTGSGPPISPSELTARIVEAMSALTRSGVVTDEAIRTALLDMGIAVSRRTVTKYRGRIP